MTLSPLVGEAVGVVRFGGPTEKDTIQYLSSQLVAKILWHNSGHG